MNSIFTFSAEQFIRFFLVKDIKGVLNISIITSLEYRNVKVLASAGGLKKGLCSYISFKYVMFK